MLPAGDKDEDEKASRLTSSRGLALIGLAISISLDELAIGFTIGLAHLPGPRNRAGGFGPTAASARSWPPGTAAQLEVARRPAQPRAAHWAAILPATPALNRARSPSRACYARRTRHS